MYTQKGDELNMEPTTNEIKFAFKKPVLHEIFNYLDCTKYAKFKIIVIHNLFLETRQVVHKFESKEDLERFILNNRAIYIRSISIERPDGITNNQTLIFQVEL